MVQTQIYTIHIAISFDKCDPNVLALNVAVDNPTEPFILMLMFVCSHSIAQRKRIKWSSSLSRCRTPSYWRTRQTNNHTEEIYFQWELKLSIHFLLCFSENSLAGCARSHCHFNEIPKLIANKHKINLQFVWVYLMHHVLDFLRSRQFGWTPCVSLTENIFAQCNRKIPI